MQRITIRRWRSILPPNRSCNLYGSSSFSPSCNSGLPQADIDVIRTGGPAVTEDVLAEIIVSNRVLGSREILLLNHTGCRSTTFTDEALNAKLSTSTGDASPAPMRFFAYKDPEQNTREQIKKVRSHPGIAKDVPVRGVIFDMETGIIREVHQASRQATA